jgi:hypothetical protein
VRAASTFASGRVICLNAGSIAAGRCCSALSVSASLRDRKLVPNRIPVHQCKCSALGLGRAKTPERVERVERPPQNCEWQSPDLRQKPQVDGSRRIRFPSVDTLLEFSHNQGHGRKEEEPRQHRILASGQPPTTDPRLALRLCQFLP